MRRSLFAALIFGCVPVTPAMGDVFWEPFDDPLGNWVSGWLFQQTNMENYYTASGSDCDPNFRGNNPCGLWIAEPQGCISGVSGSSITINFKAPFAATIQQLSFDLSPFTSTNLTIFDQSGNTLLFAPGVLAPDVCAGTNFSVTSSNGVGGFTLSTVDGTTPVEGWTAVDNFVAVTSRVINFDNLAADVAVTTQYLEATFSSNSGFVNWTLAQDLGTSLPNFICTGPDTGGVDCQHDTFVDFTCPVNNLKFLGVGIDQVGSIATVNVYENGFFSASVPVIGVGDPFTPVPVDLTAYSNVTRIEILSITNASGIGWDDFIFSITPQASWKNYGAGWPGTNGVPALTAANNPVIGANLTVSVGNSLGSTTSGFLFLGLSSANLGTGGLGGTLLVLPSFIFPISVPGAGVDMTGMIPRDPSLCGVSIFLQVIENDGGASAGYSFSRGLELILGQ